MKIIIECNLDINTWKKTQMIKPSEIKRHITKIVTQTLRSANFTCKEITISTLMTTNKKSQLLNKEFRKKDSPTNILSFPYTEENIFNNFDKYKNEEIYLGELVFAYETILKEAHELSFPMECTEKVFQDHLSHLIAHGTLHLLGFDHENDEDAEKMESLEVEILSKFGIDNPYLQNID
jgi:probable rRNA maturation factor